MGKPGAGKTVTIYFEGRPIEALEGEPVAAALMNNRIRSFRYTRKNGEERGVYCAVGRCTDCMMTIDGHANVRACITPVKEGMRVEKGIWNRKECDEI